MKTDQPTQQPTPPQRTLGVFKPVGHVVVSFATAQQADEARALLEEAGLTQGNNLFAYTDRQMLKQIAHDLDRASAMASLGQELNLIMAHKALAERGYHWLVVKAPRDMEAQEIADICRLLGAERAQYYGRFIIEELIVLASDQPQVAESPDRGLDSGTHCGREADRARLRPGPNGNYSLND